MELVAQKLTTTCLGTMITGEPVEEIGDTEKFSLASEKTKVHLRLLGGKETATNGRQRKPAMIQQVNWKKNNLRITVCDFSYLQRLVRRV